MNRVYAARVESSVMPTNTDHLLDLVAGKPAVLEILLLDLQVLFAVGEVGR
jgi:hypothetical protein